MDEKPFAESWRRMGLRDRPKYIQELLTDGRTQLADHSGQPKPRPDWFDEDLYKKGQECFRSNCLTLLMLHLVGLLQIMNVPSILSVLITSGKSDTREKAFLRYLETVRMVIGWYRGDVFTAGQCAARRIATVDGRHARLFKYAARVGAGAPTQYDMVLTQWGFCGYALIRDGPETGLLLRPGYREGLAHFWRCIGYRLGIPDSLNICSPDLAEARRRSEAILHFVMRPLLIDQPAHPRFAAMSNAMLEGVSLIVPPCDNLSYRALAWRLAFPRRHRVPARLWSRITYQAMMWLFATAWLDTWFGAAVRALGNFLLYVAVRTCAHARFVPWSSNARRKVITFLWLGAKDLWCGCCELIGAPSCGRWGKQWFHRRPIDDTVAVWRARVVAELREEVLAGYYDAAPREEGRAAG